MAWVTAVLATAWFLLLAADIFEWFYADLRHRPVWDHLFIHGPVEWVQWALLGAATVAAGIAAGRLWGSSRHGAAKYFQLLSIGLALMLIEDAGDVRHGIADYARELLGDFIFGVQTETVVDLPYFLLLAALPVYALYRYRHQVIEGPLARTYVWRAYLLYGIAATTSLVRIQVYPGLGSWIDENILGGRFPQSPRFTEEQAHFYLLDGPFEESVELLAAAAMLCIVLAFVSDSRSDPTPQEEP